MFEKIKNTESSLVEKNIIYISEYDKFNNYTIKLTSLKRKINSNDLNFLNDYKNILKYKNTDSTLVIDYSLKEKIAVEVEIKKILLNLFQLIEGTEIGLAIYKDGMMYHKVGKYEEFIR